jgi:hypothetical protein
MKNNHYHTIKESDSKRNNQTKSQKQLSLRSELINSRIHSVMTRWFMSYSGITKW